MPTTAESMTSRERWLAAVDFAPLDHLPFWPKLDGSYPPRHAGAFAGWDPAQFHRYIGSDPHQWVAPCLRYVRTRTDYREQADGRRRRQCFVTPHGTLEREYQFDQASCSWHPTRFPVQSVADIQLLTEWWLDARAELDGAQLARVQAEVRALGSGAAVATGIGESALMLWIEHLAGVENAHFLLSDYPDATLALFEAIQGDLLRCTQIVTAHHPADLLYMVENTSTTLLSVEQYRRYDWPHLRQLADLAAQAGRRMILHMCGHIRALLDDLEKLPVAGFEAFTAPPLGNATLLDGRTHCPTKALIGGTHATLWLEPAERIIAFLGQRLDELPHHRGLVVTSAGVMPPACPPDRIQTVCAWVRRYPLRLTLPPTSPPAADTAGPRPAAPTRPRTP
jgi:hypothetical protein